MTDIASCLINRWILDYECFELWREFSDNLRVHQTWQMMFIDYLKELGHSSIFMTLNVKQQDDLELINTLLIKLMNSISNASKLPPDNNTEILTPLEESLKYIDLLGESALKEPAKALLMKLKRVIRQECVVICFRCYKLKLAKTVYERVWNGFNSKESSSKSSLLNLFREDVNVSTALEPFSVSELTENCRKFFSKYFNVLLTSFLIRNAEKMFDVYGSALLLISKKKKASENSKLKHFLIHCWFAEYFCYLAWKNIDHINTAKFDWLLKFVSENNLETKSCLLIRFMFKFNERKSMEDSLSSYLSPLELCLELLNKAEKLNSDDCESSAEIASTLRWQLKRHAVLVWCGKNLYEKATIVFNRLFQNDDEDMDSNLKASLENVLKGHDQLSLDEDVLEQSVKIYFSKVFANWQPHLLDVAESIGSIVKNKVVKMASEHGNVENKKRHRTTKKLPDDFVSTDSIEEDGSTKKRRDLHRSLSNFDEEQGRKALKDDDTDSEGLEMKDDRRRKSDCRQRIWLEEEEELIYRGAKMYGVGNWAAIAKNMVVHRSEVEVRDKWKAMIKQGKVDKYVREIGPVSGLTQDAQAAESDF